MGVNQLEALQPLISLMKENGCFGVTPPNMLIHAFSNGSYGFLIMTTDTSAEHG